MTTPATLAEIALRETYDLFWDLDLPLRIDRTNEALIGRILARAGLPPGERERLFAALEASCLWDVIHDAGRDGPTLWYEPTYEVCSRLSTKGLDWLEEAVAA